MYGTNHPPISYGRGGLNIEKMISLASPLSFVGISYGEDA